MKYVSNAALLAKLETMEADLRLMRQSVAFLENTARNLLPGANKPTFPPIDKPRDPPPPVENRPTVAPPVMEPEPVMWGYNGHPQTDGQIRPERDSDPQYLWMTNGSPFVFTITVPAGKRMHEMHCRPTPLLGYPDPSLDQHEVRALGVQFSIGGADWYPDLGPGVHQIEVVSDRYTGGTAWMFRYS